MISHFSKNLTLISILYLANVKTTLANISWGSYSYKYLSAILQTSDTFIDDPQDASYTLASEGAYGYSSSYNSISGQLVEPVPVNGCPGSPGIGNSASDGPDAIYDLTRIDVDKNWIALIERGDCLFSDKINLAFNQSAAGAIIYNEGSTAIVPMEYVSPSSDFVAVMIDRMGFDELMQQFVDADENATVPMFVYISPGSPQVSNSFERIVIATISVSFLILLALSVGWVIIYYVQRFRIIHRRYKEAKRRQDLAERAIKMLKTRKLKRNDRLVKEEETCAICIDEFEKDAICLELPCHHVFHKKCIEPWVLDKGTCPMCKLNVFVALGLEHRSTAENTENGGAGNDNTPTEVLTVENRTTNLSSPETSPNFHTDIAFDNSSETSSNSSNQGHINNLQTTLAAVNHPYDSNLMNQHTTQSEQIEENPPTPAYEPSESHNLESEISPSHIPLTLKTVVNSSSSSPRTDTESRNTTPLPGIEEVIRQPGVVNESFQDDENTVKNDK